MKQLFPVCLLIMTGFHQAAREPAPPTNSGQARAVFQLRFRHLAGDRTLQLSDETYRNDWGEPFTVQRFRYYIHGLSYTDDKGVVHAAPQAYYLIDEADSDSKTIPLPAPAGGISSVSFSVGVDSLDNCNGAQAGALDPAKGMFWTWNSGYIFARLEGKSDASHAPGHYFSYHVGGFRSSQHAQRHVVLPVAATNPYTSMLVIQANVLAWFRGTHPILIGQSPVCHEPGALALQLADNYAGMFSIAAIP